MVLSRLDEARQAIRQRILAKLDALGFRGLDDLVSLEVPTEKERGDLTTSFALKAASRVKLAPRELLARLEGFADGLDSVERVEVAGPGFLNVTLRTAWLAEVVRDILGRPDTYGNATVGQGRRVLLEYVSANPTGPMVIVSGRAAAVGDTLARVMSAVGYQVWREFYVNDAGGQIATLGHALALRLRELDGEEVESTWPEGVYPGAYIKDLARAYRAEHPEVRGESVTAADYPALGAWAAERIRAGHEATLREFRVTFDRWFSERALRASGAPEKILQRLRERGYLVERDGALWFTATRFGDDKDRVMVKSDGSLTYFVPDAAYHADKFDRGFDYVIDLLGPDHHGYVQRIRAVVEALGYPADRLEVLIIQLVRLLRGKELVRMSKRGGTFVALEDLIEEAGIDPARFFLLERAPETPMDFDLNLAKLKGPDNPVYYVQYVGARIHSVLRQWREMKAPEVPVDLALLREPEERELLMLLARFPEVLIRVAEERAPQHLAKFMTELAGAFHAFYRQHRILDQAPELRQARLALAQAVLAVNIRGLSLMGIEQPEVM
ncbi:MAG: arginine--tRNA ligase [Firmicutes bacterium]|nr:arginine--tRNA ligase [Bacillota bacterium]